MKRTRIDANPRKIRCLIAKVKPKMVYVAEAQASEPRTNSQYHPQHVRGLGEPPKIMGYAQPARCSSIDTIVACKLTACQSRPLLTTPSLSMRYAKNAFRD